MKRSSQLMSPTLMKDITSSQTQIFSLENSDQLERPTVTCRPINFLISWPNTPDFKEAHHGTMLKNLTTSRKLPLNIGDFYER